MIKEETKEYYNLTKRNEVWDPHDLRKVLEYACSVEADWIMFDSNGNIDPNLPVYDW